MAANHNVKGDYYCMWLVIIFVLLLGCDSSSQNVQQSELPKFEIRDVEIKRDSDTKYSWMYKGRATLVTRDSAFQKANLLVFFKQKIKGKVKETQQVGFVSDGIGNIDLSEYYSKTDYQSDPGPPEYEWTILGYLQLQPAKLERK